MLEARFSPYPLRLCAAQGFSQVAVGLAHSVSLLGDVGQAAPQLCHLSPVIVGRVLDVAVAALDVRHVPPQLISTLLVGGERSPALVQLRTVGQPKSF